ncbi:hypothetical protein JZ751_022210 [Albula glossodonta]|uniref:Uncharacterized protein n=1 Tax=Albula glossodonta TaxID=121402 RepID=A0A8T2NU76_9TELE|nr:hypothetical protein JZ751_022210 [Albula glossodonta]
MTLAANNTGYIFRGTWKALYSVPLFPAPTHPDSARCCCGNRSELFTVKSVPGSGWIQSYTEKATARSWKIKGNRKGSEAETHMPCPAATCRPEDPRPHLPLHPPSPLPSPIAVVGFVPSSRSSL